jgi:acetyl-CoA carboxylase carboxyltransferase component
VLEIMRVVVAYDPRLILPGQVPNFAMGGTQAAKVLAQIEASSLKEKKVDEAKEAALFAKIKARYDEQVSPYYAASRL